MDPTGDIAHVADVLDYVTSQLAVTATDHCSSTSRTCLLTGKQLINNIIL